MAQKNRWPDVPGFGKHAREGAFIRRLIFEFESYLRDPVFHLTIIRAGFFSRPLPRGSRRPVLGLTAADDLTSVWTGPRLAHVKMSTNETSLRVAVLRPSASRVGSARPWSARP